MWRRPCGWVAGTCVAAALVTASTDVMAMNWELTPRIRSSATYTDNVNLAPEGQEKSDTVLELRPGFSLDGEGPRTKVNFSYDLQTLYHTRVNDTEVNHQISGFLNSELVKRTLFVDASVSRRQEISSLSGPIGVNNTTGGGNRQNVTTASVSPYLVNRLGSFAKSTLRYTHDRVYQEIGHDTYSNAVRWQLTDGPAFGRLTWSTDAQYRKVEGGVNDTGTFRSGSARLGYELGRHLEVSATGGYEDNDYPTTANGSLSGSFWDVGVRWSPSHRLDAEIRYGHRYFGNTRMASLSYRARHLLTSITYEESITTSRRRQLVAENRIPVYSGCSPATDPNCQPAGEIVLYGVESVNEFILQRRGIASMTLLGRRNSLTFAGYRSKDEYQVSDRTTIQTGATANWQWTLGRSNSFSLAGGWSRNEFLDQNREDNLYNVSATLNHDLSRRVSSFFTLRHQQRNSTDAQAEYRENAATVGISASF